MKQNKIPRNEYIRKPVGKTNPYKDDVIYSNLGQWKYPGQVTRIPSGDITMQGVPYPVYGEDNLGYSQMMYPGMDYQFPGQYVTEIPKAQKGKQKGNPISDWWYNTDDVQSTYKMAPEVDPFLINWLQHPVTQRKLKENLASNVITSDINPNTITKQALSRLNTLPMFSRELVKKAGVSYDDIVNNNELQGWKSPSTILGNPYYSGDPGELGVYMPNYHVSMVNTFNNPGLIAHEQTHATGPFQDAMEDVIWTKFLDKKDPKKRFIKEWGVGLREYDPSADVQEEPTYEEVKNKYPGIYQQWQDTEKYLDRDGMYPRIMDIRRTLKLKPGQKVDKSILENKSISNPLYDLRHYYDDDTIIDILNTIAKTKNKDQKNTAMYGGDPSLSNITGHYQVGGAQTPEEWEKEIRSVEHKIGHPSQWTLEGYKELQNKLNEYKAWRENTPKGKAVIDYHNEPNEYVVPLPSHLQVVPKKPFGGQNTKTHTHMSKGGWLDELPEANDGLNLRPHKAVAETTRIGKKDIPSSLDTLKTLAANRANRPWNQWSDKEKEDYINNPPKKMSPAQAEEWHNRAYEWSSEKAKKDKINEYVQQSVHNTLYNNPLWNSTISFTPAGSVLSLMKGTMNLGPDVYQTVKNPTDLKNYANIASDLLSMSRVSGTNIGSTGLKRVKDIKLLSSPHGDGLDIGDIKKVYDTKEKFQNKKQTGGDTKDQSQDEGEDAKAWLTNWYKNRAKSPQFEKLASERVRALEADAVGRKQMSYGDRQSSNAYYYDGNIYTHPKNPEGLKKDVLIEEYTHAMDDLYPQNNLKDITKKGLISNDAWYNTNSASKYFPTGENKYPYLSDKDEMAARLNKLRYQYDIDPTKEYSVEDMKNIIDEHKKQRVRHKENISGIEGGIDELLDVIGDNPETLLELNRSIVKNNQFNIPVAKNGGLLSKYQKKGQVQSIPKTKQLPAETTRIIRNPKIETVNKVVPYMPRYGDPTGANIYNNFIVQNRFKESKDFLNKWYTSPKYKEMISKSIEGDPNISKDKFYRTDNYPLPYISDPYTTARLTNLNESSAEFLNEEDGLTGGYASDNQITILPIGLDSRTALGHEVSHASDYYLKNTHAGVPWHSSQETYERAIPKKDIDLMSKYADINPFNRGWDEYVAKPTETRARLNAIREGAYKNKLYNPFNEKVTPETYKKLLKHKFEDAEGMEGFEPLKQLQGIYSDEEIIDLLNSVSKTKNRTSEPVSKYGGLLNNYNEDDFRRGGPYTPPKLKRKVKKQGTSKNIQSSINKIFTRNYDVFGPEGKNIYNPNVYKTGGWLDNLD